MMKKDIETRNDIEALVSEFYSVAVNDPEIGHHFEGLDLGEHLTVVVDFWEKAIFSKPVYFGNPLAVHQLLNEDRPMTSRDFARWIEIFVTSVDKEFAGETAEKAKTQARMVASSLDQRLNTEQRTNELNSYLRSS
jgi:hemoglobin